MARELLEEDDTTPIRAMLQAAQRLAAYAGGDTARLGGGRSTFHSSRVLIRLMEGWCIDHAVKTRHAALAGLSPEQRDDETVLAALYRYFGVEVAA